MISVRLQGKPFNITVIQVYAPTSNAKETEVERLYEDLQDLLELTPKKDVLFIIGDWSAKQSKPNVNRVLPRERTVQRKHPLPTTQEKTTHGHHHVVNTEI